MSRERARGVETYKLAGTEDTHRQKPQHRLAQPFVFIVDAYVLAVKDGLAVARGGDAGGGQSPSLHWPGQGCAGGCLPWYRGCACGGRGAASRPSDASSRLPPPATNTSGRLPGRPWRPMAHPPGTASRPIDPCSWRPTGGLVPCLVALQPHR
jgi:hypothetical protein